MDAANKPEAKRAGSHTQTMKAARFYQYGSPDVIAIEEVPKPVPDDDEVLVKVKAVAINPLDWHYMRGTPYLVRLQSGLRQPKQNSLGVDVAGVVEAVGKNVSTFSVGDEVFGEKGSGGAEYVCAPERLLVKKPSNATFVEAAAIPVAALTALQGLRDKARVEPGDRVLVNGASGGVGTYAVQIAKALGADVTAVASRRNQSLLLSIGADQAIDYTSTDYTSTGDKYDVIIDTVGTKSLSENRRAMEVDGRYVSVGSLEMGDWVGPLGHLAKVALGSVFGSQKMSVMLAKANQSDLEFIADLVEQGEVKSVIDRVYSLDEFADAMRYLEEGHARGKVVIEP